MFPALAVAALLALGLAVDCADDATVRPALRWAFWLAAWSWCLVDIGGRVCAMR